MIKKVVIPRKLHEGDEIRVIAPSRSLSIITQPVRDIAIKRLTQKGYKVTFSEHSEESDAFTSSSIESRVLDLHKAFSEPKVKAVLTAIGGYNSNQILDQIDYELIRTNPKILMGFSDVTALCNAIFSQTGLVTYYGPHFSSWGMISGFEYTSKAFTDAVETNNSYKLLPSETWSDDPWFIDQASRIHETNTGGKVWQGGHAKGRLVGGNLSTFALLAGTSYWPGLQGSILCLEDDDETTPQQFDRCLHALTLQPDFKNVNAILIGRFQKNSGMTTELLGQIIKSKPVMSKMPIISNLDFGHTTPITVLPIGGGAEVIANRNKYDITILNHGSMT